LPIAQPYAQPDILKSRREKRNRRVLSLLGAALLGAALLG
jgi:hypothetical protein